MQTPIKLITKFESGPDAKFKMGFLDDYGAGLLKAAVEECDDKLTKNPPALVYNKLGRQHREIGFFANPNDTFGYFYSRTCAISQQPGPAMKTLIDYINADQKSKFNGVLVNKYKDGSDYIGAHSDKEEGLDKRAGVVILTYGAARTMTFETRKNAPPCSQQLSDLIKNQSLEHNSIAVMQGAKFQHTYTHEIKKDKKCTMPRTSLTFRVHNGEGEKTKIENYLKSKAKIDELIEVETKKRIRDDDNANESSSKKIK
jgi:alkylated DNA repair dioxygenase AlkB